jgi:hypothetical protein
MPTPSLEQWAQVAQVVTGAATTLIALFALFVSVQVRNLTKTTKVVELISQCNQRFDLLSQIWYEPEKITTPQAYWGRFWSLQHDQFMLWKEGFLPDRIFAQWLDQRRSEWNRNPEFRSVSFRQGWEAARKEWSHNNEFTSFIEDVMQKSDPAVAMKRFQAEYRRQRRSAT